MGNRSRQQVEGESRALRDEVGAVADSIPVDVEQIVEQLGGSIEVRFDGDRYPESLHVATNGSFTVFVPSNTSMLRDRFTIAHELGHLWLHHNELATEPVSFHRYGSSREETEANAFAGALLMPEAEFRDAWHQHGGNLSKVARHFQVSQSAADVRRQVLGLTS